MTYSFNLVDRPWIPCIHFDGRVEELSLRDTLLMAHTLRGVQGDSPLETASLHRLLLAVLHSALRGPRSRDEWADLWNARQWDAVLVNSYLNQWHHRFDLFDQVRPFYQAVDEPPRPKSVVLLVHSMVTSDTLFDHHPPSDKETFTCEQVARSLITSHSFGIGGIYIPHPFTRYEFASWAEGIIFLIEGDNLFETLSLNLLKISDDSLVGTDSEDDCPIWEKDNPVTLSAAPVVPTGYLDFLTLQCRRILLIPESDGEKTFVRQVTIAPGLRLDSSYRDPMKHYVERTFGLAPMAFSENRMLWRDSHSLFQVHNPQNAHPPMSFDWVHNLILYGKLADNKMCRFMALGMLAEKSKANIHFYRQEQLPLPLAYLGNEHLVGQISEAISIAEQVRGKLYGAVSRFAELMLSKTADLKDGRKPDPEDVKKLIKYWAAERYYWSLLEIPFLRMLENLPTHPETITDWQEIVRSAAWNALEKIENLAGDNTAALKAAVQARSSLAVSFSILFPQPIKEATA